MRNPLLPSNPKATVWWRAGYVVSSAEFEQVSHPWATHTHKVSHHQFDDDTENQHSSVLRPSVYYKFSLELSTQSISLTWLIIFVLCPRLTSVGQENAEDISQGNGKDTNNKAQVSFGVADVTRSTLIIVSNNIDTLTTRRR